MSMQQADRYSFTIACEQAQRLLRHDAPDQQGLHTSMTTASSVAVKASFFRHGCNWLKYLSLPAQARTYGSETELDRRPRHVSTAMAKISGRAYSSFRFCQALPVQCETSCWSPAG